MNVFKHYNSKEDERKSPKSCRELTERLGVGEGGAENRNKGTGVTH